MLCMKKLSHSHSQCQGSKLGIPGTITSLSANKNDFQLHFMTQLKYQLNFRTYTKYLYMWKKHVILNVEITSSAIFGNCSKTFLLPSDNFWRIFENLRKVAGNLRKIVKKSSLLGSYNKQNNTWLLVDLEFPFSR